MNTIFSPACVMMHTGLMKVMHDSLHFGISTFDGDDKVIVRAEQQSSVVNITKK